MLPGEGVLPPETLSNELKVTVNDVFRFTCELSDSVHRRFFDNWLKRFQRSLLERLLGPPWRPSESELICPCCGSSRFIRKGFRRRVAITSKGKFSFSLAQVKCKDCGRTHRPFTGILGLTSRRRTLSELDDKALLLALKLPYRPSSELLRELSGGSLSHEGIRKIISRTASMEEIKPPAKVIHCQIDSTKVKAGSKTRGEDVQLAISVERGPEVHGRPTLIKKLIHLSVGDSAPLKATLKKVNPEYLVHDGELDVGGCAGKIQRCLWHMGHQLKHYLWQDGMPHEERSSIRKKLCNILYDKGYALRGAKIAYGKLVSQLRNSGFGTSAGHLDNARDQVFTYKKNPDLAFATTSPAEREMREINRRADVGARWSTKGIENILKLLMLKRFNQLSKNMHPG
jgi:hypothetical protein